MNKIHSPKNRLPELLMCALGVLVLLRAAFIFYPAPAWWGINICSFLPMEAGVIIAGVLLGFVVRGFMQREGVDENHPPPINIFSRSSLIVISLLAGIIFLLFPIPFALLGDGALFIGDVYRNVFLHEALPLYHEPLTMFLNARVNAILYALGENDLLVTYRVTGALFGMLFVATALKIASNVRGSHALRVFAFVLLTTCGGTLLFFGYIENYAPQYAIDLLYVALVFHMFRAKGSPWLPCAALALACLFHLQNLVLIPSFIVALGARRAMQQGTIERYGRRVYAIAAISAPVLLLIYAYFQWRPIAKLETGDNPFIPFFKAGAMSYTLLSPMHVLDIVNEHLLLAPVAIAVIIVVIVAARKNIRWTSPEMLTVCIAAFGLEAFLIGGNLGLGLSRDWDVVTFLGPVITFVAILSLENISATKIRNRVLTAAGAVALAGVACWVAVNVNSNTAVLRFKTLLDYHRSAVMPNVTRYGYENLRKMYYKQGDALHELEMDSVMLEILPWHFDLVRAMTFPETVGPSPNMKAAATLDHINWNLVRTASDAKLSEENGGDEHDVRIAPPHSGNVCTLGDVIMLNAVNQNDFYKRWSVDDVLTFADTLNARHPSLPYGMQLKGWIFFLHGNRDTAAIFFRRAIALDTTRAMPVCQLASYFNSIGQRDSLKHYARRALQLDPGYADAIKLAVMSLGGNVMTADDTIAVNVIINASRICLSQAQERHLEQKDITGITHIQEQAEEIHRQLTGEKIQ